MFLLCPDLDNRDLNFWNYFWHQLWHYSNEWSKTIMTQTSDKKRKAIKKKTSNFFLHFSVFCTCHSSNFFLNSLSFFCQEYLSHSYSWPFRCAFSYINNYWIKWWHHKDMWSNVNLPLRAKLWHEEQCSALCIQHNHVNVGIIWEKFPSSIDSSLFNCFGCYFKTLFYSRPICVARKPIKLATISHNWLFKTIKLGFTFCGAHI